MPDTQDTLSPFHLGQSDGLDGLDALEGVFGDGRKAAKLYLCDRYVVFAHVPGPDPIKVVRPP